MAYLLNNIDITQNYGIIPSQVDGGNIALRGCFDFPSRIGDISHEWGDENGSEIYSASGDLFWGGRDITFAGLVTGARPDIYDALKTLYTAVSSATGLMVFSTPYGDFSVYPKIAEPTHYRDISKLRIEFREPVPVLTGGTIPATTSNPYMIDGIPMSSFGLYTSDYEGVIILPEMKEQNFTRIESEGYKITRRKAGKVEFSAWLIAANLTAFKANVKNLYALFASAGERTFTLNNQVILVGVPVDGFKIDGIRVADGVVIGGFKCDITITSIT